MAASICMQLLYCESENPKKEISMYINSPGGVVTAGMAIYDTMQFIRPPIATLCIGQAASMGSLLLCAGTAGMRYALPNARIMVHQPSGGFSGQASDIERHAEDIIKMKRRLNEVYVKHTKKNYETIEKTLDRDYFMTAEQAKEFGLIDKVIQSRDEAEGLLATDQAVLSAGKSHQIASAAVNGSAAIWPHICVQDAAVGLARWRRDACITATSACKTAGCRAGWHDRVVNPILIWAPVACSDWA